MNTNFAEGDFVLWVVFVFRKFFDTKLFLLEDS